MRTVCKSLYFARKPSANLFDNKIAAPPTRKSVFCKRRSFRSPLYICWVISSVDKTTAVEFRLFSRSCLARSMLIKEAEHPMPPRLYVRTSDRSPNARVTIDASDGVGLNKLQLTIKKSTSFALMPVRFSKSWKVAQRTISATLRAAVIDKSGKSSFKEVYSRCDGVEMAEGLAPSRDWGMNFAGVTVGRISFTVPGGQWVASPVPDLSNRRCMKLIDSSLKQFILRRIMIISDRDTLQSRGGSKTEKSIK